MLSRISKMCREMKYIIAMVMVQMAMAGLNIFFKLSIEDGMKPRIVVAYRVFFSTLFMLPVSFIFQRNKRPKFTWSLLLLAFLSGLLGAVIPTILTISGLALTSATFTTAVAVLTPLTTFTLGALLRMESVRLGSIEGKAKVFGTLLGVGGALVFIFYRGKYIHLWSTHVDLVNHPHNVRVLLLNATNHHFSILGALLVLGGNVSYSLWLLLQVKIGQRFGGPFWNATLTNMMGSVVAMPIAFCWDRDLKEWKLGWNIRLLTVAYSAIVISGMVVAVIAWCIKSKGSLFVSIFTPISVVIVALVGSFVLDEKLYLGSIIGTLIIVGGLYLVLWGINKERKSKDMKSINTTSDLTGTNKTSKDINNLPSLSTNVP